MSKSEIYLIAAGCYCSSEGCYNFQLVQLKLPSAPHQIEYYQSIIWCCILSGSCQAAYADVLMILLGVLLPYN